MFSIVQKPLPNDALLTTYRGGARPDRWGQQGDCFEVTVHQSVSLSDFVAAFYASPVFRIERLLLQVLASAPSTDTQARAVAEGSGYSFAVWRVGERTSTQLLMCDRYEKTRSWFRVVPIGRESTTLQFGSAVATTSNERTERRSMSAAFRLLMRFHVVYSQVLLHAAVRGVATDSRTA
jgi:hypothetical protein